MNYGMDYQGGGGGSGGFGGGGGFNVGGGGGGFGGDGGGFSQGSNNGDGGGKRNRRSYDEQTIVPVTISMALSSTPKQGNGNGGGGGIDDGLLLQDGRSLHHVRIVGAIRDIEDFSTNAVYTIEDGTGLLEVKQWLDHNDCTALTELRTIISTQCHNNYVIVVGQMKDYDGRKMLIADNIRPASMMMMVSNSSSNNNNSKPSSVSPGNVLAHHMMSVVYSHALHMNRDRYVNPPPGSNMMMSSMMMNNGGSSNGGNNGVPLYNNGGNGGTGTGNGLRDAIVGCLRDMDQNSDRGVLLSDIVNALMARGYYDKKAIMAQFESLSGDGHIYSTIDDNHYKLA